MGMRLVADCTQPVPHPVTLHVRCDISHGLLEQPTATFPADVGHPRDNAIRAGWTFTGDGLVICPERHIGGLLAGERGGEG